MGCEKSLMSYIWQVLRYWFPNCTKAEFALSRWRLISKSTNPGGLFLWGSCLFIFTSQLKISINHYLSITRNDTVETWIFSTKAESQLLNRKNPRPNQLFLGTIQRNRSSWMEPNVAVCFDHLTVVLAAPDHFDVFWERKVWQFVASKIWWNLDTI